MQTKKMIQSNREIQFQNVIIPKKKFSQNKCCVCVCVCGSYSSSLFVPRFFFFNFFVDRSIDFHSGFINFSDFIFRSTIFHHHHHRHCHRVDDDDDDHDSTMI